MTADTPGVDPVTTEQPATDDAPQVIGLSGAPVQLPAGRWLAEVDDAGKLVKRDGLLVRTR